MENKKTTLGIWVFLVLTLALIAAVKFVDVAAIGPEGTSIGLSKINAFFAKTFPYNENWRELTHVLEYVTYAVMTVCALFGVYQMISRKSLLKVDSEILLLGALYVVMLGVYVLFNKVIVNYRPILVPGETALEAGFPSSHTLMACVVVSSALMIVNDYIKNIPARTVCQVILSLDLGLMVAGRMASGVHWFTDIIGAVIISALLTSIYEYLVYVTKKPEKTSETVEE